MPQVVWKPRRMNSITIVVSLLKVIAQWKHYLQKRKTMLPLDHFLPGLERLLASIISVDTRLKNIKKLSICMHFIYITYIIQTIFWNGQSYVLFSWFCLCFMWIILSPIKVSSLPNSLILICGVPDLWPNLFYNRRFTTFKWTESILAGCPIFLHLFLLLVYCIPHHNPNLLIDMSNHFLLAIS